MSQKKIEILLQRYLKQEHKRRVKANIAEVKESKNNSLKQATRGQAQTKFLRPSTSFQQKSDSSKNYRKIQFNNYGVCLYACIEDGYYDILSNGKRVRLLPDKKSGIHLKMITAVQLKDTQDIHVFCNICFHYLLNKLLSKPVKVVSNIIVVIIGESDVINKKFGRLRRLGHPTELKIVFNKNDVTEMCKQISTEFRYFKNNAHRPLTCEEALKALGVESARSYLEKFNIRTYHVDLLINDLLDDQDPRKFKPVLSMPSQLKKKTGLKKKTQAPYDPRDELIEKCKLEIVSLQRQLEELNIDYSVPSDKKPNKIQKSIGKPEEQQPVHNKLKKPTTNSESNPHQKFINKQVEKPQKIIQQVKIVEKQYAIDDSLKKSTQKGAGSQRRTTVKKVRFQGIPQRNKKLNNQIPNQSKTSKVESQHAAKELCRANPEVIEHMDNYNDAEIKKEIENLLANKGEVDTKIQKVQKKLISSRSYFYGVILRMCKTYTQMYEKHYKNIIKFNRAQEVKIAMIPHAYYRNIESDLQYNTIKQKWMMDPQTKATCKFLAKKINSFTKMKNIETTWQLFKTCVNGKHGPVPKRLVSEEFELIKNLRKFNMQCAENYNKKYRYINDSLDNVKLKFHRAYDYIQKNNLFLDTMNNIKTNSIGNGQNNG